MYSACCENTTNNHGLLRSGGGALFRLLASQSPPPAKPYRYHASNPLEVIFKPNSRNMKFSRPTEGLDFITILWCVYAAAIIWLLPDWRLSSFGLLLACGVTSSVGIWLNFRPSGYFFAAASIVGAVLYSALMLGFFEHSRPLSIRGLVTIGALLYCVYVGCVWARGDSDSPRSETSVESKSA